MWREFGLALLGGLTATGIGYLVLGKLSTWFIEHRLNVALQSSQHDLNVKLTTLTENLSRVSDILSRRNEREFAVVEVAWERMIRAVSEVENRLTTWHTGLPRFKGMEPEAVERAITNLPFSERERAKIREAHQDDRDELCAVYENQLATRECEHEWRELRNWLSTREIFMSSKIHAGFRSIADHVGHALAIAHIDGDINMALPTRRRTEITQLCRGKVTPEIKELGAAIRKRFGFDD